MVCRRMSNALSNVDGRVVEWFGVGGWEVGLEKMDEQTMNL